ncbi:MAG: restriction endonuclease subunit S [Bacteroidales bacterium]|nr:restriction endonuclease subunit S [Bacteroidales bacterium]
MEEWKEYKLGDVLTIKYGKDHKRLKDGSFPVYGSGGIMRYANEYIYKGPSILIPRKGSLNNIMYSNLPFWTVDTMFWTIINEEIVNPLYLYYSIYKKDFASLNVGSAVPSLTVPVIEDVDICLPPKEIQDKIASILKSLDDKIQNNRKINENLEQQAQALFKSWFVDFEPFRDQPFAESELGMIPEGWRVGNFGSLFDIKYGKDHKKLDDGIYPVYGSGGLMRKANKYLYQGESVLIPRKGSLNNVMYVNESFWTVDTMFYTVPKIDDIVIFAFMQLRNKDLSSMNVGSAVPSMTTEVLNNIKFVLPTDKIMFDFNSLATNLYRVIKHNESESHRLSQLRDTLLPKLMSGEIKL